jgi:hypothetical protein
MRKLIPVLFLFILISCNKKSGSDFIWEKTYGSGEALYISEAQDSGLIACGEVGGKPYMVRLDKSMAEVIDFNSSEQGLFSSVWFDTTSYIAAGSTLGKMLLVRLDNLGNIVWSKSLPAEFQVDNTSLIYTGNGNFLAVGSAGADASEDGSTSLLFVRFDTTGHVESNAVISNTGFISTQNLSLDNAGNVYLGITRKTDGSKTKASVAKFNNDFQKLWETDLYNNPDFGSASIDITLGESGDVYVTGRTELNQNEGVSNNSFVVSLTNSGTIRWKKYLESTNSGSSVIIDDDVLVILNRNCFILNLINQSDGSDAGRVKVMEICNSKDSDALGTDIVQKYDGNIFLAGSKGGSFYLALKSIVY